MKIQTLVLGMLSVSGLLYADIVYGLKSRSDDTGGTGLYLPPATLFSFNDQGTVFSAINPVTKDGLQIRADGLAYSPAKGLWCFEPTSTTLCTLYQLNPSTAAVSSSGLPFAGRQIFAAAFDRHQVLWAIDQTRDELLTISVDTGAILRTVALTKGGLPFDMTFASGDLAFNNLGKAFVVHYNTLYSLNTCTGALTELYQDTTPYTKFLVGAAIPKSRPNTLFGIDVIWTDIDNDDILAYNLANPAQPTWLFNSILKSYNAGRGDLATDVPSDLLVCSSFDADADGWTGAGLSPSDLSQVASSLPISYSGTGSISLTDNDNVWTTFAAPAKFLGNKADWLGGQIKLDMYHTTSGQRVKGPMIILVSGDNAVLCSPWTYPTDAWQQFTIPLRPADWHVTTVSGPQPSLDDMLTVLSNLKGMYVVGDYVSGTETTLIDNVCISSGLSPDLSRDGFINYEDFALFAPYWQQTGCTGPDWCQGRNLNQDGMIDLNDLEYVVSRWLQEVL